MHTVAIPFSFLVLLIYSRLRGHNGEANRLSEALSFLHAPFAAHSYPWEFVETGKKLLLVGFARIMFAAGSISRLLVAVLVSLFSLTFLTLRRPYRATLNNYLGIATSFSLTCFLLLCIAFEMGDFVEELHGTISTEYQQLYDFHSLFMSLLTGVCTLSGVILMVALCIVEIRGGPQDPRWDRLGFDRWATRGAVKFIKVGFLRKVREAPSGASTIQYSEVPVDAVYLGPPPSYVDIIAIVAPSFAVFEDSAVFTRLLNEILAESSDDDCVFFAPWSIIQQPGNHEERSAAKLAKEGELRMHTFYRVRVAIVDPRSAAGSLSQQGRTMVSLILTSYCQRIINAKEDTRLDPRKLSDPNALLDACEWDTPADRRRLDALLRRTLKDVRPIAHDRHGFETICNEIQLHWVKVGYIKQLARQRGPFPRQQDLHPDGVHIGLPPGRKWSLSHGWSSEMHPCPSGIKMQRLAAKLEALGAHDEHDGVFLE